MTFSEPAFLAEIAIRTAIIFLLVVAGLRITGKRQAGELNLHDLVMVLILGNAVQNAMTKGDGRLSVAVISAGALIALGRLFAGLLSSSSAVERLAVGGPVVLAENGRLYRPSMRREGITQTDLLAAVRDQGIADLGVVRLAVLEIDGSISVIPREPVAHH